MTTEYWSRADDVRDWLKSHNDNASLAEATAYVWNQVGCMMHELDDSDYWFLWEYDTWETLQDELVEECISRSQSMQILPARSGTYFQIMPFMHRNGYRDGNGWWVKEDRDYS